MTGGTLVIFNHFSTDSLSSLITLSGSVLFTTALPDTIMLAPAWIGVCVVWVCGWMEECDHVQIILPIPFFPLPGPGLIFVCINCQVHKAKNITNTEKLTRVGNCQNFCPKIHNFGAEKEGLSVGNNPGQKCPELRKFHDSCWLGMLATSIRCKAAGKYEVLLYDSKAVIIM